jgi:hypothetical protein
LKKIIAPQPSLFAAESRAIAPNKVATRIVVTRVLSTGSRIGSRMATQSLAKTTRLIHAATDAAAAVNY